MIAGTEGVILQSVGVYNERSTGTVQAGLIIEKTFPSIWFALQDGCEPVDYSDRWDSAILNAIRPEHRRISQSIHLTLEDESIGIGAHFFFLAFCTRRSILSLQ